MAVRGVGDAWGVRRLSWIFATTVVAPALLIVLMGLGAFGYQRWTAADLAQRDVAVQLPVLARLLEAEVASGLLPVPGPGDNEARAAIAAAAQRHANLAGAEGLGVSLLDAPSPSEVSGASNPNGPALEPLGGALTGLALGITYPPTWRAPASTALPTSMSLGLFALVVIGVFTGTVAASREIATSQRQTLLLAQVSHELRTPLTAIGLFVDTLRAGGLSPERESECLDLLGAETRRLSRRIEDMLTWARMEAGARVYDATAIEPAAIVDDAMQAFRAARLADGVEEAEGDTTLTVRISGRLPRATGDHDALVEALLNLLTNAWKHTPTPRTIRLDVVAGRGEIGFRVQDDGPGVARKDQRRIFEKFYQPREADSDGSLRGVGLGLAMVGAIARGHDGRVALESAPGAGATFTLWIRASRDDRRRAG
jgi:two-component system phosphate regulon sensor histidine kinase PhoR